MNLTERFLDWRLRRFWRVKLRSAAAAMRLRGVEPLAVERDDSATSWYVPVDPATPNFVEVEATSVGSDLAAMWEASGIPELAELGDDIARLARLIHRVDQTQSAELSDDVYAMY